MQPHSDLKYPRISAHGEEESVDVNVLFEMLNLLLADLKIIPLEQTLWLAN